MGVGEVEPVEAAVDVDPVRRVRTVALDGHRLEPGRILGRLGVRLELEEGDRAGEVHHRIGVDGVRAEVADAGDHRSARAHAEVGVGRADVAVHQRGHDLTLGKVGVQPFPDLRHRRAGRVRAAARLAWVGPASMLCSSSPSEPNCCGAPAPTSRAKPGTGLGSRRSRSVASRKLIKAWRRSASVGAAAASRRSCGPTAGGRW